MAECSTAVVRMWRRPGWVARALWRTALLLSVPQLVKTISLGAGLLDFLAGLAAEFVDAGRIAVMVAQEREHGVNDFGGHAGGGVVVKIINLLLVHRCRKWPATKLIMAAYREVEWSSRK